MSTALATQLNTLNATASVPVYDYNNTYTIHTPAYTYGFYPWYPTYWYSQRSAIEQAFRIVNVLLERKVITLKTIAQFTSLVDEIAKIV